MSKVELTPQSQVQGLTAEQVDWSLFNDPLARDKLITNHHFLDLYQDAVGARDKFLGRRIYESLNYRMAPDLKDFLDRSRPQTRFFEPEAVVSILTPESSIVADYKKRDQLEIWQFRLNPEKHLLSPDDQRKEEVISLYRGETIGYTVPYLIIYYRAGYDDPQVTFYPDIRRTTWGNSISRGTLDKHMIGLLGLGDHVVRQRLNFTVKREERERDVFGQPINEKEFTYPVEISLAQDQEDTQPKLLEKGDSL